MEEAPALSGLPPLAPDASSAAVNGDAAPPPAPAPLPAAPVSATKLPALLTPNDLMHNVVISAESEAEADNANPSVDNTLQVLDILGASKMAGANVASLVVHRDEKNLETVVDTRNKHAKDNVMSSLGLAMIQKTAPRKPAEPARASSSSSRMISCARQKRV